MIAVSNLAFPANAPSRFLAALVADEVCGIEVAPTRIASWDALSPVQLGDYRAMLAGHGLVVSSLQALLFQAEGVALLGDKTAFSRLLDHLRRVAGVGAGLGASVGVFGAPRQRSRGVMPAEEAFALGAGRLRQVAEACWAEGRLVLGLEPVPAVYGGDFLTTAEEVIAMVRAVDHPGLRVHLDTGCALLGGGDIGRAVTAAGPLLAHFHAAEPKLGDFSAPAADHVSAAAALCAAAYKGWISIEMLQPANWETAVLEAVALTRAVYGAGRRKAL